MIKTYLQASNAALLPQKILQLWMCGAKRALQFACEIKFCFFFCFHLLPLFFCSVQNTTATPTPPENTHTKTLPRYVTQRNPLICTFPQIRTFMPSQAANHLLAPRFPVLSVTSFLFIYSRKTCHSRILSEFCETRPQLYLNSSHLSDRREFKCKMIPFRILIHF